MLIATAVVSFFILLIFVPFKCAAKSVVRQGVVAVNLSIVSRVFVIAIEVGISQSYIKIGHYCKKLDAKNRSRYRLNISLFKRALRDFYLTSLDVSFIAKIDINAPIYNILRAASIMITRINHNTPANIFRCNCIGCAVEAPALRMAVSIKVNLTLIIVAILKILLSSRVKR